MRHFFPLFLTLASVLIACQPAPQSPVAAKHVVVIGIDGLSPDGIRNAETPNIDRMMREGASSMRARSVFMTSSSPNWAAMINGVGPEQSGITNNSWQPDNYIIPASHLGVEQMAPTVFSIIRDQLPEAKIACVYHWDGLGRLLESSVLDLDTTLDSEAATATVAAAYLKVEQPTFLFVHLDHVDGAGHKAGHGSGPYYASVSRADSLVGEIMAAAEAAGMLEETLFLLSADHGGLNYGHGGESLWESTIPFVMWGKGIKSEYVIRQSINQFDNPATVLYGLGLTVPSVWLGRPVRDGFVGEDAPATAYQRLAAVPQVFPPAGGYEADELTVELSSLTAGGDIRYTLDGGEPTDASPKYDGPLVLQQSATLRAKTFKGSEQSQTQEARYALLSPEQGNGVQLRYWSQPRKGRTLTGKPSFVDTVFAFDLSHINLIKGEVWYEFESWWEVKEAGEYVFELVADSPTTLSIDNQSNDQAEAKSRTFSKTLSSGRARLLLSYQPTAYSTSLQLYVSGPGLPRQKLSADQLFLQP